MYFVVTSFTHSGRVTPLLLALPLNSAQLYTTACCYGVRTTAYYTEYTLFVCVSRGRTVHSVILYRRQIKQVSMYKKMSHSWSPSANKHLARSIIGRLVVDLRFQTSFFRVSSEYIIAARPWCNGGVRWCVVVLSARGRSIYSNRLLLGVLCR